MSFSRPLVSRAFQTTLSLAALVFAPYSNATEGSAENESIDEIVVTAFRLPTEIDKTGSSLWVITDEMIQQRGFTYITDVLASAPGVTVNQNGPFGGQATARIRGASSDQTLVMIDGIIVNDTSQPGGGFNFGTLELNDIERIEILKGPQSTLWGSDAIGGVINVVTKSSENQLNGQAGFTVGSYGTAQVQGMVTAGNDIGDFRISYTDADTAGISKADEDDGNREEDGYEARTLSASVGFNLPGNARLQLSHRESDTKTEFDSFGITTGVQDGDELSQTQRSTSQVRLTFPAFDGRLENAFVYGESETERDNFRAGVPSFASGGEREVFQYQGTYTINDSQLISIGYEDEQTEVNSNDNDIQGIYALYQINPIDSLTLSMGVRQDDHSEFGKETTGRISAAWAATDTVDVQASFGEGFKAPTIFQRTFFCCGAAAPNPNLSAETSEAFDLGVTWQFNDAGRVAVTYFNQETENQIDFDFAIGGYLNRAEVDSQGIELALDYQITDSLYATTNLTYIDSEDENGDELVRTPELTGDLALLWNVNDSLSTTLSVTYNDDEEDSRGTVDAWTRLDLSAVWRPNETVEMFARFENLSDRNYQQIFGYGTPDRSAYVGFNYRF